MPDAQIEFFGAAGEVTGSCHVVTVGDRRILLDCGLIQGRRADEARNRDPFPFDAAKVDAVVLSHAHIDHSGRLPLLVKRGYRGPIYTHQASADLCNIMLIDSASLAERDTEIQNKRRERRGQGRLKPLYTVEDAEQALRQIQGQRYAQRFDVTEGISAVFHDAGHIMGSASVELLIDVPGLKRRIVFSGDLGQYDTPILRDPARLTEADLVMMECTYGGRHHRERESTYEEIASIVGSSDAGSGNVIIPAFAVGRSQEILYLFGKYYDEWGMDRWKIFLDSPMAIEASEIYWNYPNLYDGEALKLRRGVDEMPPLPNLFLTRSAAESRVINRVKNGAIIVAGSGMCTGGRVIHHLKHNLWRSDCQVMIVGYQAPGTLGRRLVDGDETVRIHGEEIRVKAKIHTVGGLSAHGDEEDLSRWYGSFTGAPPVYLVHGEPEARDRLGDRLHADYGCSVHKPLPGDTLDLGALPA
jgi:metallo-beta-lactamase family protein